jgi:hypothetical protein
MTDTPTDGDTVDPTLTLLGLTPVFVDDLEHDAIVLDDDGLILIRSGLTPARLDEVIDEVLVVASETPPEP